MFYIITLTIIVLGLLIPFLIMKAGFKTAHVIDPKEKTVELKDLPKDQHEAAKH